jgi:hypothetical protein
VAVALGWPYYLQSTPSSLLPEWVERTVAPPSVTGPVVEWSAWEELAPAFAGVVASSLVSYLCAVCLSSSKLDVLALPIGSEDDASSVIIYEHELFPGPLHPRADDVIQPWVILLLDER